MSQKIILILYVEVMPYNLPVFEELRNNGFKLIIIELDNKKLTPYSYSESQNITYKKISDFSNYQDFRKYYLMIKPNLVFVSEVMNNWYWKAARFYKKRANIPVVLGSDAQWTGSKNNWIKKLFFKITYKKCFTHILCAGLWQIEYARILGFKRNQITVPLYSANTDLYQKVNIESKRLNYPKMFLYVGRFHTDKGLTYLFDAWEQIKDKHGWKLTLIGNGPLKESLLKKNDLEILDFQSQDRICEIMNSAGCAIVPSVFEPWGLVIHEATAAGLPIIVTSTCGATNQFVINNYNGYIVTERKVQDLKFAMQKIINNTNDDLILMAERSRQLSNRITPEIVSYALLNLITNENPSCE